MKITLFNTDVIYAYEIWFSGTELCYLESFDGDTQRIALNAVQRITASPRR